MLAEISLAPSKLPPVAIIPQCTFEEEEKDALSAFK